MPTQPTFHPKRALGVLGLLTLLAIPVGNAASAETIEPGPHFQDVVRLLRTNLEGVQEEELNRAMVEGLLSHFHPRAMLVTNTAASTPTAPGSFLRRTAAYEGFLAYLGIRHVENGLPAEIATALDQLHGSNRIEGLVLDLRSASGDGYRAAAEIADRFATREGVLLKWDDVEIRTSKQDRRDRPVAVLVNSETAGAAEALAAALRLTGPAVILGSRTAGHAYAMRSFPIGEGIELRIAAAPVKAGDDGTLAEGVKPDLETAVPLDQERLWLEDPYHDPVGKNVEAATATRPRMDEAELVRRHEGLTNRPPVGRPEVPIPQTVVSPKDPVLVRALDVLKGVLRVRGLKAQPSPTAG